jgi:ribosomal protein S18 acetylase RimI-like enzyme
MELSKATLEDIDNLREICIQAYAQNFHHHWNGDGLNWYLEREFSLARLEQDLKDENRAYYIIRREGLPIGFVKLNHHSNLPDLPKAEGSELEKIYVLPSYKGKGVGKFAIEAINSIVKEKAKKIFFLCVIDTNIKAIAFYKKLGFKFHSKTRLDIPYFKEELKGMHRMFMEVIQ